MLTAPSTTPDSKQLTSQAPGRSARRQSEGNLDLLCTLLQPPPTSHLQGAPVWLKGSSSPAQGALVPPLPAEQWAPAPGPPAWLLGLPPRQQPSLGFSPGSLSRRSSALCVCVCVCVRVCVCVCGVCMHTKGKRAGGCACERRDGDTCMPLHEGRGRVRAGLQEHGRSV